MKCVATWSFEPWFQRKGMPWTHVSDMLTMARCSIELVNKHYGRPTIYTDSFGKQVFSSITPHADFEVVYDNLYDNISPSLWALAKLKTYAAQTQPYLHFDLDFLFLEKMEDSLLDCDLLVHRFEDLMEWPEISDPSYNIEKVKHYNKLPPCMLRDCINHIPAVNVGIMFMNNMELNKKYTDIALQMVNDNRHLFGTSRALQMCVIEQQTLGVLLHDNPQYICKTLMPTGWDHPVVTSQFAHFVGANYKTDDYEIVVELRKKLLRPWRSQQIVDTANFIQHERNRRWNSLQHGALSRGSNV